MANPICLSPLKFYDALEKQERYKSYAYGHVSPVVMPFNILYPFQFVAQPDETAIISARLRDALSNKDVTGNILQSLVERGLRMQSVRPYNVVVFPGNFPIPSITQVGQYYLEIITDTRKYFSEVFCFTTVPSDYLEIEYWNPESDFFLKNGVVSFSNDFRFKLLLSTELGKPKYTYEEEATNRLGYKYTESIISKKVYCFNTLLPEYICDAMRIVKMCSNIKITNRGDEYKLISFDMEVDWQEQGDLASVTCEFEVDNILMTLGSFAQGAYNSDFNKDFNNDFR